MSPPAAAIGIGAVAPGGDRPPAEAFFLPAVPGQRFCLYHPPHPDRPRRGAFIYIHPFAEEMNRSRRMAAMQARQLADLGYGVLAIDLFGCGDSSGDFGDAGWDDWKADLALARRWLRDRIAPALPIGLWGLRLGALLALDFVNDHLNDKANDKANEHARQPESAEADRIGALILWSPVVSGKSFMTQFLRLRLGSDMLAGNAKNATSSDTASDSTSGNKAAPAASSTQAMREALRAGATLEIAGYRIAPSLALAIDALDAAALAPLSPSASMQLPIYWFDLIRSADSPTPPATAAALAAWRARLPGADLHYTQVVGPSFWATPELSVCPALLTATAALLDRLPTASSAFGAAP